MVRKFRVGLEGEQGGLVAVKVESKGGGGDWAEGSGGGTYGVLTIDG